MKILNYAKFALTTLAVTASFAVPGDCFAIGGLFRRPAAVYYYPNATVIAPYTTAYYAPYAAAPVVAPYSAYRVSYYGAYTAPVTTYRPAFVYDPYVTGSVAVTRPVYAYRPLFAPRAAQPVYASQYLSSYYTPYVASYATPVTTYYAPLAAPTYTYYAPYAAAPACVGCTTSSSQSYLQSAPLGSTSVINDNSALEAPAILPSDVVPANGSASPNETNKEAKPNKGGSSKDGSSNKNGSGDAAAKNTGILKTNGPMRKQDKNMDSDGVEINFPNPNEAENKLDKAVWRTSTQKYELVSLKEGESSATPAKKSASTPNRPQPNKNVWRPSNR